MNEVDEPKKSREPFKCASCCGLRPLELHLHELSKYCDLLENTRPGVSITSGEPGSPTVNTIGIAKWLMLASQVDKVLMDTSSFEVAQDYCEPVLDLQKSDAEHRGSLAARLTRFVFFCNALEEVYRFCEPTYNRLYADKSSLASRGRKLNAPSMKAAAVLREFGAQITRPPVDMAHLVDNFSKLAHIYQSELSVKLELSVKDPIDIAYGLDIVRCLRNHVAHGTFPILDNPEYSMLISTHVHWVVLTLINQAVRIGALNIQLLLAVDNEGFKSFLYQQLCDDEETGRYFFDHCTTTYLLSLHRNQEFGLNEAASFGWADNSWRENHS